MNSSTNFLIALIIGLALGFLVGKATGPHYQGVAADSRLYIVDQSTGSFYYRGYPPPSPRDFYKLNPLDGSQNPVNSSSNITAKGGSFLPNESP
jgi:hypothetical protein